MGVVALDAVGPNSSRTLVKIDAELRLLKQPKDVLCVCGRLLDLVEERQSGVRFPRRCRLHAKHGALAVTLRSYPFTCKRMIELGWLRAVSQA
jgi:hypothetical protein